MEIRAEQRPARVWRPVEAVWASKAACPFDGTFQEARLRRALPISPGTSLLAKYW